MDRRVADPSLAVRARAGPLDPAVAESALRTLEEYDPPADGAWRAVESGTGDDGERFVLADHDPATGDVEDGRANRFEAWDDDGTLRVAFVADRDGVGEFVPVTDRILAVTDLEVGRIRVAVTVAEELDPSAVGTPEEGALTATVEDGRTRVSLTRSGPALRGSAAVLVEAFDRTVREAGELLP